MRNLGVMIHVRSSELESFMRKHEMEKKQLLDRINDQAMTIHHLTHNIRLIQRAGTYQGEGASETHAGKNASTQLNSTIRSEHPEYLASDNREVKNHKASSNSFSMHEDHAGDDTRQVNFCILSYHFLIAHLIIYV